MMYDVFADWEINLFCNFSCPYCFFYSRRKRRDPRYSGHDPKRAAHFFNNRSETWLIHMTGGEPFFQPDFIELCSRLTEKHYISVNSNFSTPNVYDFADAVDPRKVARINAALHVSERRDFEEFINKIAYFNQRKFDIHVSQVMYPPILNRFEKTFQHLKNKGILVRPRVFRGSYGMKTYPQSYTDEERRLFMRYFSECEKTLNPLEERNLDWLFSHDRHLLNGELSFKGIHCGAGKDYIYIRYNGDVIRCIGGDRRGNIFRGQINLDTEPELCKAEICFCPHYGLRYAKGMPSGKVLRFRGLRMMLYRKAFDWKENVQYVLSRPWGPSSTHEARPSFE